jgi:S-adenosylmethionine hydrolase
MAAIAPNVRIVNLTHTLTPFDVAGAAAVLADVVPFAPVSIAVLVVDPGVGSSRRAIALRCKRGDILVGPDNGLLTSVAESVGGAHAARELTNTRYHGQSRSSTFHARDVFSPVAAHLSLGVAFEDVGPELALENLVSLVPPRIEIGPGRISAEVTNVDRFGNVRLSAKIDALREAQLAEYDSLVVSAPGIQRGVRRATTYQDLAIDELGLIEDSFGWLCLVMNRAAAAQRLGTKRGSRVEIFEPQNSHT